MQVEAPAPPQELEEKQMQVGELQAVAARPPEEAEEEEEEVKASVAVEWWESASSPLSDEGAWTEEAEARLVLPLVSASVFARVCSEVAPVVVAAAVQA